MQIWQLAKSLNGAYFYVEEAAQLFTTVVLFTSFLKCMQIFNKRERDTKSTHAWFFKTAKNL